MAKRQSGEYDERDESVEHILLDKLKSELLTAATSLMANKEPDEQSIELLKAAIDEWAMYRPSTAGPPKAVLLDWAGVYPNKSIQPYLSRIVEACFVPKGIKSP